MCGSDQCAKRVVRNAKRLEVGRGQCCSHSVVQTGDRPTEGRIDRSLSFSIDWLPWCRRKLACYPGGAIIRGVWKRGHPALCYRIEQRICSDHQACSAGVYKSSACMPEIATIIASEHEVAAQWIIVRR